LWRETKVHIHTKSKIKTISDKIFEVAFMVAHMLGMSFRELPAVWTRSGAQALKLYTGTPQL
jgi:hypothetical protein